jgi:hypothetical protein
MLVNKWLAVGARDRLGRKHFACVALHAVHAVLRSFKVRVRIISRTVPVYLLRSVYLHAGARDRRVLDQKETLRRQALLVAELLGRQEAGLAVKSYFTLSKQPLQIVHVRMSI